MASVAISQRLREARRRAGLSQRDVYQMLGIGQSTFSSWECGVSEPSIAIFLKLCDFYGIVDIRGYFCGEDESAVHTLPDAREREVLEKLSHLSERSVMAVMNCLDFEYETTISERRQTRQARLRKIRVFVQPAAAGIGNYLDSVDAEELLLDAPESADIGIRISGDSMEPRIHDGEIVFVKYQPSVEPGEIGIFNLNGDAYCKKLEYLEGEPHLVSLNPAYRPIKVHEGDDIITVGRVLL